MDREAVPDDAVATVEQPELDEDDWPEWTPLVDWTQYIHQDPNILVGKPVVRGTRLSAEFLLELYAAGWSEEQVLAEYSHLTRDALRAVLAFAAQCVRERYPVVWPSHTT